MKIKLIITFILFIIFIIIIKNKHFKDFNYINDINKSDYENIEFAIIKRLECPICGLFSDYIVYLGCINLFLTKGFLPIINFGSFNYNLKSNNSNNTLIDNQWEFFFYQPLGYTLNDIIKNAKNIQFFECNSSIFRPDENIFFNKVLLNFWHNIAKIYLPIKKNILIEVNSIKKNLFGNSNNILGILIRGTDYIAMKPKNHSIPPTSSMVIKDLKEFYLKNKYDYFFISTEDDLIREQFIKEFNSKLKFLISKKINYDYKSKNYLYLNQNIDLKFIKIYLLNMIILSKCIDIITARTSGALGVFILSNGFRNSKIYNLGYYI